VVSLGSPRLHSFSSFFPVFKLHESSCLQVSQSLLLPNLLTSSSGAVFPAPDFLLFLLL
jgi:hypothetical protein